MASTRPILSVLIASCLLRSTLAVTTITIQPNATRTTLSHCGATCTLDYTVVQVSWLPTVSTIFAYGGPSSLAKAISDYSQYWEQYAPQSVLGSVATNYAAPDFTATCCDDAWYISSGVKAHYDTNVATATADPETCAPTDAIFTGRPVGTVQSSAPTDLPFLQHDCSVSTTIIKSVLTQVTIVAATPNPPTGTANGQSTWWGDSDTITIQLPPIPTPYFTISPCPFSGRISCSYSVGTMNLVWEQTTITITGNATDLSSLEADLSTSIEDTGDWVNGSSGWDESLGATVPCCSESIYLDNDVIIDYDGYCPTTVLTGYNTILPQDIAWGFIVGEPANCNVNIGGGIASTKTAVFVAKVTADIDSGTTTSPPATREPETVPPSTTRPTSTIISKETEIIESSKTTPRTTPRTTGRTTPRTTTRRLPPTTTPRGQQNQPPPAQSSQSPNPPPNQPPNPVGSSANNGGNTPPNTNVIPNPNSGGTTAPNGGPVNTPVPDSSPINTPVPDGTTPSNTPNGPGNNTPQNNPTPNNIPINSQSLAPEPSLSTIFGTSAVAITTTDAAGSQTVISSLTTVPVATAVNVITTDSQGNSVTTRVTFSNPTATAGDSNSSTNGPAVEPANVSASSHSSRTTVFTVTTRVGTGMTTETRTSIVVDGETTLGAGTTSAGDESNSGAAAPTDGSGPTTTGSPSGAVPSKSMPLPLLALLSFIVAVAVL
ncbi:hypothetical protein ABW20_dc0106059 [Dactylellina cionopaga]|nr:hypothetical protein ABW20_dc0106059 [Dactylellina cionopaga]